MMVRCGFASVSALLFIFFRMFCDFLLFVCFYLCMKSVLVMWDWVWCIVSLPRLDHCNLTLVNFRLLELCVCCVLCENNVKNSSGRQRQSRFGIRPAKNEMHQLMSSHICDWVGCCWWNCFFFFYLFFPDHGYRVTDQTRGDTIDGSECKFVFLANWNELSFIQSTEQPLGIYS